MYWAWFCVTASAASRKGRWRNTLLRVSAPLRLGPETAIIPLEQAWNEFRATFMTVVPVDDTELARLVAVAIRFCSDEVRVGQSFDAKADGRMVKRSSCHAADLFRRPAAWRVSATKLRKEVRWAARSTSWSSELVNIRQ